MGSALENNWVHATVLIENEWGEKGTGFLIQRHVGNKGSRVFLVTNKHVINKNNELRKQTNMIKLHMNKKPKGHPVKRILVDYSFDDNWRKEHPDQDVDVFALEITPLIVNYPEINKIIPDYTWFGDIEEYDITAGDEIVTLGYPLGLSHRTSNFPLLRNGIIATRIGETLKDEVEENGVIRNRIVRGFLIDGATIPGSSGSPVVLRPISGRLVKNVIEMGLAPALLLGIVAETLYAPVRTSRVDILSFAGLGLAFDAVTIKETIEMFF